jgi:rod shape-determining protein MreD
MRHRALFLFLLAFACLSRISFLHHLELIGVAPDPVLVLVAAWALLWGPTEAALLLPLAGLATDLAQGWPVGLSILGLMPIPLLATFQELRVMAVTLPLAVGVVAVATVAHHLITLSVRAAMGQGLPWGEVLTKEAVPEVLVNALAISIVYPPLQLVRRFLGFPPQGLTIGR